jgi:DNA-binding NarL/FixJ family response regulator
MIGVAIVEDHRVVAEALAAFLRSDPEIEVRGIAGTVAEATAVCAETRPDLVLLDWRLTDGTGAEAAAAIRAVLPEAVFLFLSAEDSDEAVLAAVEAGASGFLTKSTAGDRLVEAVKAAAAGEMLVPPARLAALLARKRRADDRGRQRTHLLGELTSRELEILRLMTLGHDNRRIGADLHISYETVRTHVRRVLEKLDARTKLEAVAKAVEAGLDRD